MPSYVVRTVLAAIAKDEAAYLPEWIFHHLRVGFDQILIYINRTNDNSREILHLISSTLSNVRLIEADYLATQPSQRLSEFIDPNFERGNPLQARAYADAFCYAKDNGFDYVSFLDVDEFLHVEEGCIASLIRACSPHPSMLKFKWFGVGFERQKFGPTFVNSLVGVKARQCKFMLSTGIRKLAIGSTHHAFVEDGESPSWIAGLYPLRADTNHREIMPWSDQAFILHRAFRSRPEFFALLVRGEAGGNTMNQFDGFKLSRMRKPIQRDTINFSEEHVQQYALAYQEFIQLHGIEAELNKAQALVMQRAAAAKKRYLEMPAKLELLSQFLSAYGLPSYNVVVTEKGQQ